ncbi:MAG: GNAT family N-acetyltransferase [Proteobacteria bacterium]|nr:GNAT family N-acetyltransferase [Pseudomonadota bacterium]
MATWIASTPGACNSGRSLGCDDLDRFGWESVAQIMQRDGALGFRLLPQERAEELSRWMSSRSYRIDFCDPFIGEREAVLGAAEKILSHPLPSGLRWGPAPNGENKRYVRAIQVLMAANGVAPYSGSMLSGQQEPARTVVVLDPSDAIVAVAFGHKPHNSHSAYRDFGYGSAVVVAPAYRGCGLGRYVNAEIAVTVLHELGGTHFYGLVSIGNLRSRRMVEACALRQSPNLIAAEAVAINRQHTRYKSFNI